MFNYVSPTEPSLDYGFSRLAKLVPRHSGDPARLSKEVVLKRAAEVAEAFYSFPVNGMVELPAKEEKEVGDLLVPWQGKCKDQKII